MLEEGVGGEKAFNDKISAKMLFIFLCAFNGKC